MKCQECHERPATLHFSQVIQGQKMEVHVCNVCAKEKGYMNYPEDGYSLHHLLSGLFNFDTSNIASAQGTTYQQVNELQCPKCELTFSEFKQIGKFGCAVCYETFNERLDPIFRRVHAGNTKHNGKIPKRQGGDLHKKKQVEALKDQLKSLVENEAFEEAAKVRDKIKALNQDQDKPEAGDQS
ncbi:UvrB/UvrC motif-containing protein [Virgibacillus salexigens]|uniref:Protein-arginine kinase activator protein n=1 Tax=Virgibacillus kapii TaxID=1638645 RepID=A0ABQ2DVX8_9BACI|nr:UvrB/UvrC motif-containing protein [Virgibacillus kapii]GGJ74672.1 protein-arginine kinase activator protein [Virgibacillus kapii]